MFKNCLSGIKYFLKETWLIHVITLTMLATAIIFVETIRREEPDTQDHSKNSENQVQLQGMINRAFADTYNLDVEGIKAISSINSSFEENRPEQLIAPESFNRTYDYYIDNLELYFADEDGKIYQIPTRGMAVKIGSPVRSVVYLSNSKPNEENRPEQLIAPESFNRTYDYYIDNLELYFADEDGKIYQIPTRGMAVKIGSPVRSVVYLSNPKPN